MLSLRAKRSNLVESHTAINKYCPLPFRERGGFESPPAMLLTAMMPLAARRRVTFLCLSAKKSNQKKAHPESRRTPWASRLNRARAELAERKNSVRLRHRLAAPPGRGCDARRRLRVPTSKPTPFTEKRDIVCVGRVRRAAQ